MDAMVGAAMSIFSSAWRIFTLSRRASPDEIPTPDSIQKVKKKIGIVAICGAVVAISWICIFFTQFDRPRPRPIDPKKDLEVGQRLAEGTASLIGNKGKIIIVTLDPKMAVGPGFKKQLEAFRETIARHREITLVDTEVLAFGEPSLSSSALFEILEKRHDLSAIVSFADFPFLKNEETARLAQNTPKIAVFSESSPIGMKKLFENGVIQFAITHRGPAPRSSVAVDSKPTREGFDQSYIVITPDNISDLP